jgi:lipocalin
MDLVLAAHMTLSPFEPFKYSGAWYETASIKKGFFGLGQTDCMDTRGVYEYDSDRDEIDVATQCRHLDGHVSGIKGIVTCPPTKSKRGLVSCSLRFPSAPYVPPSTYTILETDYDSYAIVESGLGPKSSAPFVQLYSRYSRPGLRFIEAKREALRHWGYDPDELHITPVTLEGEPQVKSSLAGY